MYWVSRITVTLVIFAQFWTLGSCFLIWSPQDESQLVVVRKYNEQCQWYNSGIMGLIPRTFNRTTICRCKFISVYECSTLTVHKSNMSRSSELNNTWTSFHSRKFKAPAPHNSTVLSSMLTTTPTTTSASTDTNDKDDKSLSTSTMGLFPHFSQGTSTVSIEPLLLKSSAQNSSNSPASPTSTNATTSLQETRR